MARNAGTVTKSLLCSNTGLNGWRIGCLRKIRSSKDSTKSLKNSTMKDTFKNRSERNEGVTTPAMILFKDRDIITKRPEGMEYGAYKFLRTHQKKVIDMLFKSKPSRKVQRLMPIRIGYNYHP
jgi:hypothetical protein